nr:signal peptide peptidase SppA [Prevotella sp.]
MKGFLKSIFATFIGIILFCSVFAVFGFISIVGMIASGNSTPSISDNSVLVMNLQGEITDKSQENLLGQLTGNTVNTLNVSDITKAIKNAKNDEKIKGIYLQGGYTTAQPALCQEIRDALTDFRKSGKWIISYADQYSQASYYLCSTADKTYLNPSGMLDWHGLASQPQFTKDLYAKFGVRFVVAKVGKFKSYTEEYTEDKMSDANKEQVNRFLGNIWQHMLTDVSTSRKINKDSLNHYADRINMFEDPQLYVKNKMIDGFCYEDEIKNIVKKKLGIEEDDDISQVSVDDVNMAHQDDDSGEEIAVYYCQGSIVQNAPQEVFSQGEDCIVAPTVCKDLEDLADDDDVKAIVLRINSGGGDAYASEQLWHTIAVINKKKPVVVSMAGMAASGAYYMSMGARKIIAEPTTLTGSIGIFGLIPDVSGLLTQKLGIKFDEVKTNRNSTFQGVPLARPFNSEEMASLQGYINRGYSLFRKRVADGRKMSVADVEKIAQGRVWTGEDALKVHLIDQLGNLNTAVKEAAKYAKLSEYKTTDYPAEASLFDQLINSTTNKGNYLDEQLRFVLGDAYEPFIQLRTINNREVLQAVCPYSLQIKN